MTITINPKNVWKWTKISLLVGAITLNITFGVRSAIRMVDDPKPEYNIMKVKAVDGGEVGFIHYYADVAPYKVGDIFIYLSRDQDGNIVHYGPKLVVVELLASKIEDSKTVDDSWLHYDTKTDTVKPAK